MTPEELAAKWDIGSRLGCRCDGCIAGLIEEEVAIARESARALEREACAGLTEGYPLVTPTCEVCNGVASRVARAIRARGEAPR